MDPKYNSCKLEKNNGSTSTVVATDIAVYIFREPFLNVHSNTLKHNWLSLDNNGLQ